MKDPYPHAHGKRLLELLNARSMVSFDLFVKKKELGLLKQSVRDLQCELRRLNTEIERVGQIRSRLALASSDGRLTPHGANQAGKRHL